MTTTKKIITAVVSVITAAALTVGGIFIYRKYFSDSEVKGKVFVQKVAEVNSAESFLVADSFSGVIESQSSKDIKYDTGKTVKNVKVKVGDSVKKGDVLFTYDVDDIKLQIEKAKLEEEEQENDIKSKKGEIESLEKEKAKLSGDAAVANTSQILSLKSDIAKAEYEVKTKKIEIKNLEKSLKNTSVKAPIAGTVKNLKENLSPAGGDEEMGSGDESSDVIMTITRDGELKVKGVVNEQNVGSVTEGTPVIIKTRTDGKSYKGTVKSVNTKPEKSSGNEYGMEEDEMKTSSKYSFYVEPESTKDFKLGQHVIIDLDMGQEDTIEKNGIWLYEDFICKEGEKTFVWVKNDKDKIEKRYVETGTHDDRNGDVEIKSGISDSDYIAYPSKDIQKGMTASTDISDMSIPENDLNGMEDGMGEMDEEGMMGEEDMQDIDMSGLDMSDVDIEKEVTGDGENAKVDKVVDEPADGDTEE